MDKFGGIDLAGLMHDAPGFPIPEAVSGRVLHIDADFLAYQCSAQGKGDQKTFEDMKHNATVIVDNLQSLAGATAVHMHLTPSSSTKGGRRDHALLKGYQLNRVGKEHPQYLGIMRIWLADSYPGTLHEECEADDGMSSAQYDAIAKGQRELSVICSKDKDLAMVPGLHLDWDYGGLTDTGADDYGYIAIDRSKSSPKCVGLGQKFFWAQLLMGDTADNISGLPKFFVGNKPKAVGPVMAVDLLSDCKTNREAFLFVRDAYRVYGERAGFKNYRDGTPVPWQLAFLSECRLLWMRRNKHDPDCVIKWLKEIAV